MTGNISKFNIKVMDNNQTIHFIKTNHCSIARLGDGELSIIEGNPASFEKTSRSLRDQLSNVMNMKSNSNLLICINNVFNGLNQFTPEARAYWEGHLSMKSNQKFFKQLENSRNFFGSASVTRPYMDYQDRQEAKYIFDKFKDIWRNKDILIVEGCYTRSGVGNDLFSSARSVERIICPAAHSWHKKDKIEKLIRKYGKGKIVLVMLGMTATIIAAELSSFTQVLDLGHLDAEYDWFNMGATEKVKLPNKHTPENADYGIGTFDDENYKQEIVADISLPYRIEHLLLSILRFMYKRVKAVVIKWI